MTQVLNYWMGDTEIRHELPDASEIVISGVHWGEHWELFTPAYWASQLRMSGMETMHQSPYRSCGNLSEELVFCMLGGFGITAELATAVFQACKDARLISRLESSIDAWTSFLSQPFKVNGQIKNYRYPNQKAKFIAGAMLYLKSNSMEGYGGKELRDALLKIKGVGPKTAGWVARNFLDSDDVAILDIHLIRAGLLCGLFTPTQNVSRDYFEMEERFIEFCRALNARPAILDCLIWDQMRTYGAVAIEALKRKLNPAISSNHVPLQLQMPLPA